MAIDQNLIAGGITIAGVLTVLRGLNALEMRVEKMIRAYHESDERRNKDRALIASEVAGLAKQKDLDKTHRIAKHLEASCTQCKPLTETSAIERGGAQ
jgi:alcohol dehydrogenase class IV